MGGKKRHNYKNLKIWLLGIEIAKDISDEFNFLAISKCDDNNCVELSILGLGLELELEFLKFCLII